MTKETIFQNLNRVLKETNFLNLGEKRRGKVRDIYDQGDKLILVATDRYSAFDRNLALIPFKGQVLTQVALYWLAATKHIIPNHFLTSPDPNVIVGKKCQVLPVEVVPRAYITGVTGTALWVLYQKGQRDFGNFTLPEGLKKNQKLDQPVLTPTTKDDTHDRPLTPQQIVEEGIVNYELWKKVEDASLRLFDFGQKLAAEKGLVLVDTKYEFGLDEQNNLMLIDEIHTPDSSRFWQAATYQERFANGQEPEYFDKEFLRLWFREHCDPYKDEVLPEAPPELIAELSSRYIRIYEQITGQNFEIDLTIDIPERIAKNLEKYHL